MSDCTVRIHTNLQECRFLSKQYIEDLKEKVYIGGLTSIDEENLYCLLARISQCMAHGDKKELSFKLIDKK